MYKRTRWGNTLITESIPSHHRSPKQTAAPAGINDRLRMKETFFDFICLTWSIGSGYETEWYSSTITSPQSWRKTQEWSLLHLRKINKQQNIFFPSITIWNLIFYYKNKLIIFCVSTVFVLSCTSSHMLRNIWSTRLKLMGLDQCPVALTHLQPSSSRLEGFWGCFSVQSRWVIPQVHIITPPPPCMTLSLKYSC